MHNALGTALLLCLVLAGCVPTAAYNVETTTDEFTGKTTHRLTNRAQVTLSTAVDLTVLKTEGEETVYLGGNYLADDWLFIEGGILRVDGQNHEFTFGSQREVLYGGRISELFIVPLTPEKFRQVAYATEALMRLEGRGYFDFAIPPEMREQWQQFYEEYVTTN
jgi:hypothetical protein